MKDGRSENLMTLNIHWDEMSWGTGLRGRGRSAILPIKNIIVCLLQTPAWPWDPTAWHTDHSVLPPTQPHADQQRMIPGSGRNAHRYLHKVRVSLLSVAYNQFYSITDIWVFSFCLGWQRLAGGFISIATSSEHQPTGGLLWRGWRSRRQRHNTEQAGQLSEAPTRQWWIMIFNSSIQISHSLLHCFVLLAWCPNLSLIITLSPVKARQWIITAR